MKTHHTSFLKSVAQMLAKLQRLKPLLLVIFALLISTSSFSQNIYDNLDTTAAGRATRKQQINSLRKQVLTFIDEFADEEMFDKSLETRRLGKNRTLIDSLESYYDQIGIDFLTLTKLNINQFWAEAFSSRKAYSVNGKIDTLQLLNKTGRTVLFKLQIDSVSSMNDFKINSQVIFGESFKTFLADKNIQGLEAEINNYLQQNLNKQTANSPDQYRQPVAATMSWIYKFFLAKIPTEARQELLNQRDAEDLADEVFTHAYTNFKVDFINPTYGIDSYKATYGTAWENNYQHGFLSDGKSYAIPYVSLNLQATDNFLQAHFTNTKKDTLKIKHLRFKNKDGSYIPPNHITIIDDYTVQINLTAITSKDYLYACWGEKKLGKVRIQPFQPLEKKVMLVPVGKDLNGAELQAIQTTLDKVYKQAVCNWQVDIQEVYTPTEAINLTIPADEGLNQYSRQMREFARTYTTEKNIQLRNTYLIFIIDGFIKETDGTPSDENGYMPRGRDLGFVTHHSLEQTKGITLAHELGHGAFGLKHSWKDEGPAIGKSDNLMDYTANATHLTYKQWKAIHNPLPTVSYLDGIEEGKYDADDEVYQKILNEIRCAYASGDSEYESSFLGRLAKIRPFLDQDNLQLGNHVIEDIDMYWKPNVSGYKIPIPSSRNGFTYVYNKAFPDFYTLTLGDGHGGLIINTDEEPAMKDLIDYLSPSMADIRAELQSILPKHLSHLQPKQIEDIRSIANCATRLMTPEDKYKLIKGILSSFNNIHEDEEDLILDLMATTTGQSNSKALYDLILGDKALFENLMTSLDNIGGNEENYDRLAIELFRMFLEGYKNNLPKPTTNIKIYLPQTGKSAFCQISLRVSRTKNNFTITGKDLDWSVYNKLSPLGYTAPAGAGQQTAVVQYDCQAAYKSRIPVTLSLYDYIDVEVFPNSILPLEEGRYRMPGFLIYIIAKGDQNEALANLSDVAWTILGMVTPIDELYLLTKAIKYTKTANVFAFDVAAVKTAVLANKLEIQKADDFAELSKIASSNGLTSSLEKYVKLADGLANGVEGVITQAQNLLSVTWKNNIKGFLSATDAQVFWNNTSKKFKHLVEENYYLKFDEVTGNLLFGNHKTGEILGFYEGVSNATIINEKGLKGILGKLKIYHGVSGSPSYVVANVSSGARIIANPNKTATIVGNYTRFGYSAGDMKTLVADELLGNLKTAQFGPKKGGFNVLNISNETIALHGGFDNFWNVFNKPWLEEAIDRGDDIWAASNPMELNLLFKDLSLVPVNSLKTPESLARYLENLNDPAVLNQITGFGKEAQILSKSGYKYDITLKMFVK